MNACAKKKAKINQEKRRSNDDIRYYERLTNNTRQYITRCFKKLDEAVADGKIHGVDSELVHKMKKETEECIDRYNKEYLARNIILKDLKKHHSEVRNRLDEVMAKNGL